MPTWVARRTPASFPHEYPRGWIFRFKAIPKGPLYIIFYYGGPDEALGPQDGSCNRNTWNLEQLGREEVPSSSSGDIQDVEQSEY